MVDMITIEKETTMIERTGFGPRLISFHGDPKIKAKYVDRVRAHQASDELIQGYGYWKDGKGCAVGCTLHRSTLHRGGNPGDHPHTGYETELGIPIAIAHLEDHIFEALPMLEARGFPLQFLQSIPVGADLSGVIPRFLHWLMVGPEDGIINFTAHQGVKDVIQLAGDLWKRVVDGDMVTQEEWKAAVWSVTDLKSAFPTRTYCSLESAARYHVVDSITMSTAYAVAAGGAYPSTVYSPLRAANATDHYILASGCKYSKKVAIKLLELLAAAPVLARV